MTAPASSSLRIHWPHRHIDEPANPYMAQHDARPLRVTFQSERLDGLAGEAGVAIVLLRELCELPQLDAFDTEAGQFAHVEIGAARPEDDQALVHVRYPDGRYVLTSVWPASQWARDAARLASRERQGASILGDMHRDLLVAAAHQAIHSDLLVTSSGCLLNNRADSMIARANPRSPVEAARLVGHFLRTRGLMAHPVQAGRPVSVGRYWFYWVLTRHRLPGMWRYFSLCLDADKAGVANIGSVGGSVLVRSLRALKARDAIGEQFYRDQSHETQDWMLYHFDYVTLSLSGALDAMASVGAMAYGLGKHAGLGTSFRSKKFREDIKKQGGQALHAAVTDQRFLALMELLSVPRNTIHGAALHPVLAQTPSHDETFVTVGGADAVRLVRAAGILGGLDGWGLTLSSSGELRLEPYAYAAALVREGLDAINVVADATEVEHFLPAGHQPRLTSPPNGGMFAAEVRERIGLLG